MKAALVVELFALLSSACSGLGVVDGGSTSGGGGSSNTTAAAATSSSASVGSTSATGTTESTGSATTGSGGSGGDDGNDASNDATIPESGDGPLDDAATEASPTCDNQGMPGACVAPPGDGGCASVTSYCQRLSTLVKPAVHVAVASCIQALPACDDAQAARCVKTALFAACADASADATCADVSRVCASTIPTTIEECQQFLKGMTPAGRQAVLTCLSSADAGPTCPAGVFACIRGL